MASGAPSWADQWGAGGIGAMEDDVTRFQKDTGKNKNLGGRGGLAKAKATAMVGVRKIKKGSFCCVKWIKHQCKGKSTSK